MSTIQITCPHCKEESEIHLESDARMVVLSCAHCKTSLMYYYGETFQVDSVEMSTLSEKRMQAVQGYMKLKDPNQVSATQTSKTLAKRKGEPAHAVGAPVLDRQIHEDDLTNLRIDLETAEDVLDFINRL